MKRASIVAGSFLLAASGAFLGGGTSCVPAPDANAVTELVQPDYETYRQYVDPYIQRRCGTLDCHGQPGRAYRIYGVNGFRLYNIDAGLVSGQQPTVEAEVRANYQAAIGIEPEEMSRVVAKQGEDVDRLLLLRKPLRLERHKGGPAMSEDDAGYRCVVAWLRVRTVQPTEDGEALEVIPEEQREPMSEQGKKFCEQAQSYP